MAGYSQADIANICGVSVTSVKKWENPKRPNQPPADILDYIEQLHQIHLDEVEAAVNMVLNADEELAEETGGEQSPVVLAIYATNSEDLRKPAGAINADTYATAQHLQHLGFEVQFDYPEFVDEFYPFPIDE